MTSRGVFAFRRPRHAIWILFYVAAASLVVPQSARADTVCAYASAAPVLSFGNDWSERRLELLRRQAAHRHGGSIGWKLGPRGVELCSGAVSSDARARYRIALVAPVWQRYGALISAAARRHGVPAELILTAIIEETGGKPDAIVRYPGYVSDAATPQRISVGLGQMLLSTAQRLLPGRRIDRSHLLDPATSIDLVARFFVLVYRQTGFDPPLAASIYNSGSLRRVPGNRWNVPNPRYVDSFVAVFNASVTHLARQPIRPRESFAALFGESDRAQE